MLGANDLDRAFGPLIPRNINGAPLLVQRMKTAGNTPEGALKTHKNNVFFATMTGWQTCWHIVSAKSERRIFVKKPQTAGKILRS